MKKKLKPLKYILIFLSPFIIISLLFYTVHIFIFIFEQPIFVKIIKNIPHVTIDINENISISTYLTICVYILAMEVAGVLSYQLFRLSEIELKTQKRKLQVQFNIALVQVKNEIYKNHEIYRPNGNMGDEDCIENFMGNLNLKFEYDVWEKFKPIFYEYEGKLGVEINDLYSKLQKLEFSKNEGEVYYNIDEMHGFGNSLIRKVMYLYNYKSFDDVLNMSSKSKFHDV